MVSESSQKIRFDKKLFRLSNWRVTEFDQLKKQVQIISHKHIEIGIINSKFFETEIHMNYV